MGNRHCVRETPDDGFPAGDVPVGYQKPRFSASKCSASGADGALLLPLASRSVSESTSAGCSASLPPSFLETDPETIFKQVGRHKQCIGVLRHCERADLTWDSPTRTPSPLSSPTQEKKWRHDPTLSASGRAHATTIGVSLSFAVSEESLLRFDVVVSSPYRRCMETAVRLCAELRVPLAIDERVGEVQNTSVMGETVHEEVERFHRSLEHNTKFAEAHGVEVISIEDLCGPTSSNDLPRWQESIQKAFTRYGKAFELYVSSGKSILCVTHGMGLVSITHKFCEDFHTTNPSMGDYFICDVSGVTAESTKHRPRYRVLTHSSATSVENAGSSSGKFKRSTSCPAVEALAQLPATRAPRRPSVQIAPPNLEAVQELSSSERLQPLSVRRGKVLPSCIPQKNAALN